MLWDGPGLDHCTPLNIIPEVQGQSISCTCPLGKCRYVENQYSCVITSHFIQAGWDMKPWQFSREPHCEFQSVCLTRICSLLQALHPHCNHCPQTGSFSSAIWRKCSTPSVRVCSNLSFYGRCWAQSRGPSVSLSHTKELHWYGQTSPDINGRRHLATCYCNFLKVVLKSSAHQRWEWPCLPSEGNLDS